MPKLPPLVPLLLLALAAGLLLAKEGADSQDAALWIYATGQSRGALDPCECVEGMAGGFPRRLALLTAERKQRPRRLYVDLGDQTGKAFDPRLLEKKTEAAYELLRMAGAAAAVVGDLDLRLGPDKLGRLAQRAGVTLLGANLRDGAGERPFAASTRVRVAGAAKEVLLVGLLDPELGDPSGELEVGDPLAAAKAELAAAEGELYRVLLFHGPAKRAAALRRLPGVDLVLCGHDQERTQPLRAEAGLAPLLEVVRDARSLARVGLGGRARAEHLLLSGRVPDDRAARARVERYYREVSDLPGAKRTPPAEGGQLVGSRECAGCHDQEYKVFAGTKHHGVQKRILAKDPKRAKLAECLACHVTGPGFQGGFVSLVETPHLGEVGCESCHGVGGDHVAVGGSAGYGLRAGGPKSWKPLCVTCHDATNSPGFDFEKALAKIKHWTP